MKIDVGVIGGGAAGLTVSSLLPSSLEVIVFEEDSRIGYPKHCTGLVGLLTTEFYTSLLDRSIVVNKYYSVSFIIGGDVFSINSREPLAYRIDRPLLEEKLYDRTVSRGHSVLFRERVFDTKPYCIETRGKEYSVDYIVLAEGSKHTITRKYIGFVKKYIGYQYRVRVGSVNPYNLYVVYPSMVREGFLWITPLDSDQALIGYLYSRALSRDYLFKKCSRIVEGIGSVLEGFGGPIPVDKVKWSGLEPVLPIGDTIPSTKPFSGGGLYGISVLTPYLVEAIVKEKPCLYWRRLWMYKRKQDLQLLIKNISLKLGGLAYTPLLISRLYRFGVSIGGREYDMHERILYKSIPILVTQPWILLQNLSSLKNLLKP